MSRARHDRAEAHADARPDASRTVGEFLDPAAVGGRAVDRQALDSISHELRTPITTIYAGARILRRDAVPGPVRAEVAEAVESEAERLFRVVEDLLAVARTASGSRLVREPVLVQHVVRSVLRSDEIRRAIGDRLRTDLPVAIPPAFADPAAVAHATRNLVVAAAQLAPSATPIDLVLTATTSSIELRVVDRGPAFEPTESGRLFEPFYVPSQAASSGDPGAGLTLAAARALVVAMGGRTWATRRGDAGELGFALPRSREE